MINLENNAIIFGFNDQNTQPLWYLGYIENNHSDSLINYPLLLADWYTRKIKERRQDLKFTYKPYGDLKDIGKNQEKEIIFGRFREIIDLNIPSIPIYMPFYAQLYEDIKDKYIMIPTGVFFRVVDKEIPYDKIYKFISKEDKKFVARYLSSHEVFKDDSVVTCIIQIGYLTTYITRGVLHASMGIYDKAEIEYKKALDIDVNCKDAYYNLGIVYFNRGLYEKASFNFKQVLKLDPNNINAKQMLEECKKEKFLTMSNNFW